MKLTLNTGLQNIVTINISHSLKMSMNLLDPLFEPEISCSCVTVDGYEVRNLLSHDPSARSTGFLAENFIKPPVNITIEFGRPVDIREVRLDGKVGSQRLAGVEIYSVSSERWNKRATNCQRLEDVPMILIGRGMKRAGDELDNSLFVFRNAAYVERHCDGEKDEGVEGQVYELRHRLQRQLSSVVALCVRVTRTFNSSTVALRSVLIRGQPSYMDSVRPIGSSQGLSRVSATTAATAAATSAATADASSAHWNSSVLTVSETCRDRLEHYPANNVHQRCQRTSSTHCLLHPGTLTTAPSPHNRVPSYPQCPASPDRQDLGQAKGHILQSSQYLESSHGHTTRSFEGHDERSADKGHVDIPEEFIDALTQELMTSPTLLPCGQTIDQSTLTRFIDQEAMWGRPPSDPFTGRTLTCSHSATSNLYLKARIDQFLLANPLTFLHCSQSQGLTLGRANNSSASTGVSNLLTRSMRSHVAVALKDNCTTTPNNLTSAQDSCALRDTLSFTGNPSRLLDAQSLVGNTTGSSAVRKSRQSAAVECIIVESVGSIAAPVDTADAAASTAQCTDTLSDTSSEIGRVTSRGTRRNTGRDTPRDISRDTSTYTSRDTCGYISKETSRDTSTYTSRDTPRENSRDISRNTSTDTSRDTSRDTSTDTSRGTPRETNRDLKRSLGGDDVRTDQSKRTKREQVNVERYVNLDSPVNSARRGSDCGRVVGVSNTESTDIEVKCDHSSSDIEVKCDHSSSDVEVKCDVEVRLAQSLETEIRKTLSALPLFMSSTAAVSKPLSDLSSAPTCDQCTKVNSRVGSSSAGREAISLYLLTCRHVICRQCLVACEGSGVGSRGGGGASGIGEGGSGIGSGRVGAEFRTCAVCDTPILRHLAVRLHSY